MNNSKGEQTTQNNAVCLKKEDKILLIGAISAISIFLLCYLGMVTWLFIDLGMPTMMPLTVEGVVLIIGAFLSIAFAFSVTYVFIQIYLGISGYILYRKPKVKSRVIK